MSATLTENVRIAGDMQEKVDELRAMFPELSEPEVKELLNAHGGDLMQIVDKLLLQPSPPKSTSTNDTSRTQEQTSTTPGNPAVSTLGSVSISASPTHSHQSTTSISKPSGTDSQVSPWGHGDAAQNALSNPSVILSNRDTSPTKRLEESYSVPLTPVQRPAHDVESPVEARSATQTTPSKPLLRSISPPKPRLAPTISSPSIIPQHFDQVGSFSPGSNDSRDNLRNASLTSLPASLPTNSSELNTIPVDHPESHNFLHVDRPSKSHLTLVHPTPSTPSRDTSLGPLSAQSPYSTTSASPSSQLSASMSSSRLNDERNNRLRAAEAQFQMLMASVSEMDSAQQQEIDRQEARIHQLEAELAALTAEKTTWVGRLQTVSQASVQLREQVSHQVITIEQLTELLQARDKMIAALNAKVTSFQPVEGAEALRAQFETTLQQQTSQHQGGDVRQAMELFAATFQQAFASALLASQATKPQLPKE